MYFPRFTGETITVKGTGRAIRQCAITPAGSTLETTDNYANPVWVTDKLQVLTLDYAAATSVIAGDVLIIRGLEFTVTGTPFSHYSVFGTGAGGVQIEVAISGNPGAVVPENPGTEPENPGTEPDPEPVTDWTDPDTYSPVNTDVLEYARSVGLATKTPSSALYGTYGGGAVDIATGNYSGDLTVTEVPETSRAIYSINATSRYTSPTFWDDKDFITGWKDLNLKFRVTWETGYMAHATPTGGLVTNLGTDVVPINSVWDLTNGRRIRDYRTHEYMALKEKK